MELFEIIKIAVRNRAQSEHIISIKLQRKIDRFDVRVVVMSLVLLLLLWLLLLIAVAELFVVVIAVIVVDGYEDMQIQTSFIPNHPFHT